MNLLPSVKIIQVAVAEASGTGDVLSDVVDTQGFNGVMFLASLGTADAGNGLVAQQGSAADGSDMADLAATVAGKAGLVLDVYKPSPSGRYVRVKVERGAATTVDAVFALLYEGRQGAIDSVSDDLAASLVVSP